MPVDDRTRLNLHRRRAEVLGPDDADTLMSHLPPVTWNDVATKHDLDDLRDAVRTEMQTMELTLRREMQTGFANLRTEFVEATNRHLKWLVTFAAAWTSLLVALVRLIP